MGATDKKYHFIYKTTNIVTNKFYVGMHSTDDLGDGYIGSGRRLKLSIAKYGIDNHVLEILEFCDSRNALCGRERDIITEELLADERCMNLKLGGKGGFLPIEACRKGGQQKHLSALSSRNCTRLRDPVVRQKARETLMETIAQRRAIGEELCFIGVDKAARAQKLASDEVKAKRKDTFDKIGHQRGSTNSQYGTCWIHKDGQAKKIKKNEVDSWMALGWERGRK